MALCCIEYLLTSLCPFFAVLSKLEASRLVRSIIAFGLRIIDACFLQWLDYPGTQARELGLASCDLWLQASPARPYLGIRARTNRVPPGRCADGPTQKPKVAADVTSRKARLGPRTPTRNRLMAMA